MTVLRSPILALALVAACDGNAADGSSSSSSLSSSSSSSLSSSLSSSSSSLLPAGSSAVETQSSLSWLGFPAQPSIELAHGLQHQGAKIYVPARWKVQALGNGMNDSHDGHVAYVFAEPLAHPKAAPRGPFRRDAVVFLVSASGRDRLADVSVDGVTTGRFSLTADVTEVKWETAREANNGAVSVGVRQGRGKMSGEDVALWQLRREEPGSGGTVLVLAALRDGAAPQAERELHAILATFSAR